MLTYKIIEKKENIYTYKYFPQGKDLKAEGGIIEIDIENKTFNILTVAQLDVLQEISSEEKIQILNHINALRENKNYPKLDMDDFNKNNTDFIFASSLINEIYKQIDNNSIMEKGIIIN